MRTQCTKCTGNKVEKGLHTWKGHRYLKRMPTAHTQQAAGNQGLSSQKKSDQTTVWKPEAITEIIKLDETLGRGYKISRIRSISLQVTAFKHIRNQRVQEKKWGEPWRPAPDGQKGASGGKGQQPHTHRSMGRVGRERSVVGKLGKSPVISESTERGIETKFKWRVNK